MSVRKSLVARFVWETARQISASLRLLDEVEDRDQRPSDFTARELAWFRRAM